LIWGTVKQLCIKGEGGEHRAPEMLEINNKRSKSQRLAGIPSFGTLVGEQALIQVVLQAQNFKQKNQTIQITGRQSAVLLKPTTAF